MNRSMAARMSHSAWMLPVAITLATVALAVLTLWLDDLSSDALDVPSDEPVVGGTHLLVAIAGAAMIAAAVMALLTPLALAQAHARLGLRALDVPLREPAFQIAFGLLLATMVYALVVLYATAGAPVDVPRLSLATAVALATIALVALIPYTRALWRSMQPHTILGRVAADLVAAIRANPPVHDHEERYYTDYGDSVWVETERDGYVHDIDVDAILAAARAHEGMVQLQKRPGQFVVHNQIIAEVYGRTPAARAALSQAVHDAFDLRAERSAEHNPSYHAHLLVEIATRALAINDIYTAMNCIDHLAAALALAIRQGLPDPEVCDDTHQVRVLRHALRPTALLNATFHPLRQAAASSVPVTLRMLEALTQIVGCAPDRSTAEAIENHANDVAHTALLYMKIETDKQALRERMAAFSAARQARFRMYSFSELML